MFVSVKKCRQYFIVYTAVLWQNRRTEVTEFVLNGK